MVFFHIDSCEATQKKKKTIAFGRGENCDQNKNEDERKLKTTSVETIGNGRRERASVRFVSHVNELDGKVREKMQRNRDETAIFSDSKSI